jgi:hypothetical protein
MAWTEQCKVAFHANCTAKLGKYKNKNRKLTGVLKALSKESEIPFETLRQWWYDQTQSNAIHVENHTDKKERPEVGAICGRCGENEVYLKNGKPLTIESKFYGLCNCCRRNQQHIEQVDRTANVDNGIMTVCPHCEKVHYVVLESNHNRKRG